MKKNILHFGMTAKAVMIALLIGVVGMMKGNAQIGSFAVNYGDYWLEYYFNYGTTNLDLYHYYNGNGAGPSSLIIPSTVTYQNIEYNVVKIGRDGEPVFQYSDPSSITSIVIPESVTTIGWYAFQGCNNLTSISIPESVTTIELGAFYECSSLSNITIPETVTTIGQEAFYGTGWYNNQADGVLYLDSCCLGYKGDQPFGVLNIQDGTRLVSEYAFTECYSLSSVVIPNTVIHIGSFTFFCTSISEVTLSNSLTSIEQNVFNGCNFLTSVDIPNSVTSIGSGAFSNCMNLTAVNIPDGVTYIGRDAFMFTNLNSLTLPNSLQTIGGCAFSACFNLSGTLVIPNSVTTIEEEAFYLCDSLTSLTIGNSVSYIEQRAFNCSGLTSINVLTETPPDLQIIYCGGPFASVDKSIPVYVPYGTIAAYQVAPGWNEFTNYQELPPTGTSQTFNLAADWNWWSSNVDITLGELKEALGSNGLRIVAQDGKFATYNANSGTWSGNLQDIELGKMYKIRTNEACSITVSGTTVNPSDHPILLYPGNNWIGFISNENMSLDAALGDFTPTDRDVIKASNGKATYYQGYGWQGSLNRLEPGKGYIYKSNATENRTFTFPTSN